MPLFVPLVVAFAVIMLIAVGTLLGPGPSGTLLDDAVPAARFPDQHGDVVVGERRVTRADVQRWMELYVSGTRAGYFSWNVDGREPATATANGTGNAQWFVNSYLVGFQPLDVESPSLALPLIARKKTYTRDRVQYNGRREVWQTSREAWIATRGDCEDHALLLADWLIEMGFDARVALGSYRGGGHAWVVVIDDERQYLLEATNKQTRRRPLPRAETTQGYSADVQFNRESFWVNTGHAATRDYAGPHWEQRSRFVRPTDDGA